MKFKGIKRTTYTDRWDEALPIGNGTIGGLVFGNPLHEVIETNHEELFLPLPENSEARPFYGADRLEEMRKMLHEGKFKEATEFYIQGLRKDGASDDIIWTNPYETATKILIDIEDANDCDVSDYEQKLDFMTAEATVSFKLKNESVVRRSFVSRSRNMMAVDMTKEGEAFNANVFLAPLKDVKHLENIDISASGNIITAEIMHSEDESGYISIARIITDGETECEPGNYISIKGAHSLLVFYTLAPWKRRMEATRVIALRQLEDLLPEYDTLLKEHEAIHKELFEKVMVEFSPSEEEYTNEEICGLCTESELAPEFLERMTDFGRYLLIASFGKLPPNLQGIWNGKVNPPWSSDYTLDENIQMMMWQVLPGGLNSFAYNYFDWLESYTEDFRKNAQSYYGCNGIFCAARVSTDGFHRHFNEEWPMVLWTAGAGWLSSVYQDYYEFTGDENVLMRGIRYFREVVEFYEDFMQIDENGKYEFAPSYSPENTPLGNDSPTAINATMDVAVAKEVYTNLINGCKLLGMYEEEVEKWEKEKAMLPDYAINEDGALKEWIPANLKDDYHHRHSSHMYPVFPGHEALEEGNDSLLEACHKAAEYRLLDGVDAISGWGLAHLANISARLRDDNLWYLALNRLIQKFTLKNFFTGHNEHSLFQMDANLGITAAVYEMFAYSDTEKVVLFPVWSDRFSTMSIKGLRARGNVVIESLSRDEDDFIVTVTNNGRKTVRIVCPEGFSFRNGDREYELQPSETVSLNGVRR